MRKSHKKSSTSGLTSSWKLETIPGLTAEEQNCWQVRCLARRLPDGTIQSPALEQLRKWQKNNEKEYEKLLRAIRYGSSTALHRNQDLIRPDEKKRGGYEFKNTHCRCRLLFFYHPDKQQMIICTSTYWKGKGAHKKDQDQAFATCARIKEQYATNK